MRILICDDHKIVRDGLEHILRQMGPSYIIEQAANGIKALAKQKVEPFDIVILDISLPDRNGLEILESIKIKWPATNVLMLSMHPQEQYAVRALKLGASGYLTKDTATEELLLAVRKASEGGKYISQSMAENLAFYLNRNTDGPRHEALSAREFEIMTRIANGKSLQDISNELFISAKTVSTYRSRLLEKMGMTRNSELTRYCLENNLI